MSMGNLNKIIILFKSIFFYIKKKIIKISFKINKYYNFNNKYELYILKNYYFYKLNFIIFFFIYFLKKKIIKILFKANEYYNSNDKYELYISKNYYHYQSLNYYFYKLSYIYFYFILLFVVWILLLLTLNLILILYYVFSSLPYDIIWLIQFWLENIKIYFFLNNDYFLFTGVFKQMIEEVMILPSNFNETALEFYWIDFTKNFDDIIILKPFSFENWLYDFPQHIPFFNMIFYIELFLMSIIENSNYIIEQIYIWWTIVYDFMIDLFFDFIDDFINYFGYYTIIKLFNFIDFMFFFFFNNYLKIILIYYDFWMFIIEICLLTIKYILLSILDFVVYLFKPIIYFFLSFKYIFLLVQIIYKFFANLYLNIFIYISHFEFLSENTYNFLIVRQSMKYMYTELILKNFLFISYIYIKIYFHIILIFFFFFIKSIFYINWNLMNDISYDNYLAVCYSLWDLYIYVYSNILNSDLSWYFYTNMPNFLLLYYFIWILVFLFLLLLIWILYKILNVFFKS
jgi:hypothetical protein